MFGRPSLRRLAAAAVIVVVAMTAVVITLERTSLLRASPELPQIGGHFDLSTADGSRVSERTFRGKWLLVYFGYTSCPDVCPTTLSSMAQALQALGPLADKIQPLFITLDPARDKPEIVGEYANDFDPRFVGLTGNVREIAAAAGDFHVYYVARHLGNNEYVIDHSSFIYVLDPGGKFVRLLTGDLPGHQLADELRKLLG